MTTCWLVALVLWLLGVWPMMNMCRVVPLIYPGQAAGGAVLRERINWLIAVAWPLATVLQLFLYRKRPRCD